MKNVTKAMIVFGTLIVLVSSLIAGCGKNKEEKEKAEQNRTKASTTANETIANTVGEESNLDSTAKNETIDFFEEKEVLEPGKAAPKKPEYVVLKWAHEDIGEPGVFSEPSYDFVFYSGGIESGLLRPGSKISKDGTLYVDVVGPEGPKLHAIDIKSGKILKSKEIEPGYKLYGISEKTVYLLVAPCRYTYEYEIESLLALDRTNWNLLWEKGPKELGKMLLIEKGILYRRGTEIGLLNEFTGKPELLCKPRDVVKDLAKDLAKEVYVVDALGIVSPSHFKALLVAEYIPLDRRSVKSSYASLVLDLSSGEVLSAKEWSHEPWILGQCKEADGKFFLPTKEGSRYHIISIDINTGQIKRETEELLIATLLEVTKRFLIICGKIEQRGTLYTLWYGIDAANGKILWKKWAKIDYQKGIAPPLFMEGEEWTEMVDEILLIGRGNRLTLVDALSGEIVAQREDFPAVPRTHLAVYKDMLIVGTQNGLRAYRIKGAKKVEATEPPTAAGTSPPSQQKSEDKEPFDKTETEHPNKEELVDALEDLRRAMMKKVQTETDVTAHCFTSVKEYRRAKFLADVLRPVLRVLQGTLSVLSKISDTTTLSGQVKTSLDNAQYVSEATSLFFMVNGLRESGKKLYYAIDDTAGYVKIVRDMLQAADQTTVVRMDPRAYKQVIKQYLDSEQGTPLVIARTSELAPDKKPVKGALVLYKIIREEFRTLIDQIQRSELPQDFPLKDVIAETEKLKHQIIEAGVHNIDVHYSIYHQGRKVHQSRKLGAVAEHNKAFAQVAGALAKRLDIEIYAECAQLVATGADAAYIVTYKVPGAGEAVKMTQQVSLLPQIVIEGKKMFTVDPEEQFYQMPQEMLFSLAIEFSSLLRIADDTVLSLTELLKETRSQVPPSEVQPTPTSTKQKEPAKQIEKQVEEAVKSLFKKLLRKKR